MGNTKLESQLVALQTNLLNFAYSLTMNRSDAEDLLQDTTLKVLDNEDKYTQNVNFKGWVFTIMKNLFINNCRKELRNGNVVDRSEDLYLMNSNADLSPETPEGSVSVREITGMLEQLPTELRKPFSMHLAGYKYAEIAKYTELPVGTIKSRIFFARRRLQDLLSDYR